MTAERSESSIKLRLRSVVLLHKAVYGCKTQRQAVINCVSSRELWEKAVYGCRTQVKAIRPEAELHNK